MRQTYALRHLLAVFGISQAAAASIPRSEVNITRSECHALPGDHAWPRHSEWLQLNESVHGRLIASRPLAQACHGITHDDVACAKVQANWTNPPLYFMDPVNVMSPYWLNNSCSPYTGVNSSCTLGNIASFAINVSCASDVAAGLAFAKKHNIRLSIKNTGHDYLGRSTGEGSLALWTHNLKDISFLEYNSSSYAGPAVKLGAGVQAYEAYAATHEQGLRITGGFCPTVGIVGGYVQGAGHGPLEGEYGLAADNTLEFEVVTAEGEHLVASPDQNADLYWALNGGGGGSYAVVISQTTRGHRDGPIAGASLTFNNTDDEAYWSAIESWQTNLLLFDDIVGFNSFFGFTNESFVLYSAALVDADETIMESIMKPFIDELVKLGLPYVYEANSKPTFYDHLSFYTPDLPFGIYTTNSVLGGRLIPRSTVETNLQDLMQTFRNITGNKDHQFRINGIASNVTHARVGNSPESNAVLPAWRDALYWLNMDVYFDPAGPFSAVSELQAQMNENQDALKAVTPGSGAYMNEGTFDNPDWKLDYYGPNYERLLQVKNKYDPNHVFYGPASVGSEFWTQASDGRLCKAK